MISHLPYDLCTGTVKLQKEILATLKELSLFENLQYLTQYYIDWSRMEIYSNEIFSEFRN